MAESAALGRVVNGLGRVRDNDYDGWWYGTRERPRTATDQKKYVFFQQAYSDNPGSISWRLQAGFHTNFWGGTAWGTCGMYVIIGSDNLQGQPGVASEQMVATGFMTYYYGRGIGSMRGPTRYVKTAP